MHQINYQGKLRDATLNTAVPDDLYNIEFKIYTDPSIGSPIWTETRTGANKVALKSGLFSSMLGEIASLDGIDWNQPLYLSVNIGSTSTIPVWDGEMSPRKKFGSVPAAFYADFASSSNRLGGLASSSFLRSDATNATGTIVNLNSATGTFETVISHTANISGTTTAGTVVSTSLATSTFAGGINLSSGCLSVGGTCLSFTDTSFSTTSADYWAGNRNFFSTSSANYWISLQNTFSTTSADAWLATKDKGVFFSTTSASYLLASMDKGFFFSTTSVAYWESTQSRFGTTSVDYWMTVRNFFGTSSANFWANSSSTIAKTYSNNVYSGQNTFLASTTLQNLTALNATTSNLVVAFGATTTSLNIRNLASTTNLIVSATGTVGVLNITSTATSTFNRGINLAGGCFAIGGTCLSFTDTSFSTTSADYWAGNRNFFSTSSANYWISLQNTFSTTSADAWLATKDKGVFFSTTSASYLLSSVDKGIYFSTTSTDAWYNSTDRFSTSSVTYWDSVQNRWSTTSSDYWKGQNNFFSTTSADYLASQRNFFSTTSVTYWDATVARWATSSSNYWLATLPTSIFWSTTSADYFLSQKDKGYFFSTTSSDAWLATKDKGAFFSTTSADFWKTQNNFFSTSSSDFLATQRNFFSTSSANYLLANTDKGYFFSTTSGNYLLGATDKGFFFSTTSSQAWLNTLGHDQFFATTSADFWKTQNNFFSTSSSDFLATQRNFFSTSSANYLLANTDKGYFFSTTSANAWLVLNQGNAFSTTSANYWANSSTTMVKTYSNNVFTGQNTFLSSTTLQNFTAVLGTTTKLTTTDVVIPTLGGDYGGMIVGDNAFPNRAIGSTDAAGIRMYAGASTVSGLFSEVNGQLLSYAVNVTQIGARDTSRVGGIFRMDTRVNTPYFSIKRQLGVSTEYSDLQIAQTGDIGLGASFASDRNAFDAQVHILTRMATGTGLMIQGLAGQTGNLFATEDSGGIVMDAIDASGNLAIGTSTADARLSIMSPNMMVMSVASTTGVELLQAKNLSTNFGLALDAGAFIDRNSYMGEEFNAFRTSRTIGADFGGNQAASFGDSRGWGVYSTNNNCAFSSPASAVNGTIRIAATANNNGCMAIMDEAAGTAHAIVYAANLPVMLMKVRPTLVSANNYMYVGVGNPTDAQVVELSNFIGFTNNGGTTWTGRVTTGGTPQSVACTGQTISTTQFALLKIEVRSATNIRFFVDNNVSNGVDFVECGAIGTGIPAVGLAPLVEYQYRPGGAVGSLDVDFHRIWQDDSNQPEGVVTENRALIPGNRTQFDVDAMSVGYFAGSVRIGEENNGNNATDVMGLGASTDYTLAVNGATAAKAFVALSGKSRLKDIASVSASDKSSILDKIRNINVSTFAYADEVCPTGNNVSYASSGCGKRLGIVAEDAPDEILSTDRRGIDLVKFSTFILAGIQALDEKIAAIEIRLKKIEDMLATTTIQNAIGSFFQTVGSTISASVASVKNMAAENVTTKTINVEEGVTMRDKNGNLGCMRLDDASSGSFKVTQGMCGVISPEQNKAVESSIENLNSTTGGNVNVSSASEHLPPIIHIIGDNPARIPLKTTYIDLGATATGVSQNGSSAIMVDVSGDQIDTSKVGTHVITYSAKDGFGQETKAMRTVDVYDSSPKPVIEQTQGTTTVSTTIPALDGGGLDGVVSVSVVSSDTPKIEATSTVVSVPNISTSSGSIPAGNNSEPPNVIPPVPLEPVKDVAVQSQFPTVEPSLSNPIQESVVEDGSAKP